MRRLLILLLLLSLAGVACGGGEEAVPTVVPPADFEPQNDEAETDGADADSPRAGDQTDGPSDRVPATWTPGAPLVQPTPLTSPAIDGTPAPENGAEEEGTPDADDNIDAPSEDDNIYVVVAGDTLAEIANRFGVDVYTLAEVNSIENIDEIEVGQRLVIPEE